jgi:hypothetical protein
MHSKRILHRALHEQLMQKAEAFRIEAHRALWRARVTAAMIERECPSAFVKWKREVHGLPRYPKIKINLDHDRTWPNEREP